MDSQPPRKSSSQTMKQDLYITSTKFQMMLWDAAWKKICGLVNKVSVTNVKNIAHELFNENLFRGRGIFCSACVKLVLSYPTISNVVAALVAVVNYKIPEIGELLLKRLIVLFRVACAQKQTPRLASLAKFVAHLVNQQVIIEDTALEMVNLLLQHDGNVGLALVFVRDCGKVLQEFSPQGLNDLFRRLSGLLVEGAIDKRVQFMIQQLFLIKKYNFQGYPRFRPELDLLKKTVVHVCDFKNENIDPEIYLDTFRPDPDFWTNEMIYEKLKKKIIRKKSFKDGAVSDAGSSNEVDDSDGSIEEQEEETVTNLVILQSMIYLTVMSSAGFEEAAHKLLRIKVEPCQEMELCYMLIEGCCLERTFNPLYARLGKRFCMINKVYKENFQTCFITQYTKVHWLETNHLCNVAKFFAHLLAIDALPWHVMAYIRLTDENTACTSRVFITILFQELAEQLGVTSLKERLSDPIIQDSFGSIFPKDTPQNIRLSISFFTAIGLGGIVDGLRNYLNEMPKLESEDVGDHKRQRTF